MEDKFLDHNSEAWEVQQHDSSFQGGPMLLLVGSRRASLHRSEGKTQEAALFTGTCSCVNKLTPERKTSIPLSH